MYRKLGSILNYIIFCSQFISVYFCMVKIVKNHFDATSQAGSNWNVNMKICTIWWWANARDWTSFKFLQWINEWHITRSPSSQLFAQLNSWKIIYSEEGTVGALVRAWVQYHIVPWGSSKRIFPYSNLGMNT